MRWPKADPEGRASPRAGAQAPVRDRARPKGSSCGLDKKYVLASFLLLASCKDVATVHLTFGAQRTPLAFRCRDASQRILPVRAVDKNRVFRVAILVDFVRLGGVPGCRPSDIAQWCIGHGCTPITDDPAHARVCFDYERQLGTLASGDDALKAMGDALADVDGRMISDDAPHEPVLVRAVATAQPCSDFTGAEAVYDTTQLVGCAMSCPVQLDSVGGDVSLELPTLSDKCEDGVDACATGMLTQ
jgi:hypothetical protein